MHISRLHVPRIASLCTNIGLVGMCLVPLRTYKNGMLCHSFGGDVISYACLMNLNEKICSRFLRSLQLERLILTWPEGVPLRLMLVSLFFSLKVPLMFVGLDHVKV